MATTDTIALQPAEQQITLGCPLCGSAAALQYRGHPGYQRPSRFDIYSCAACDTKFVDPLESSSAVYDLIYRHIEDVRGYARYERFARTVLRRRDPLAYLADEEDAYWAIEQYLAVHCHIKAPRILEVGSGLGYLTYAISRRGYPIRGLDISRVAVEDARRHFGDLYDCGDLFSVVAAREGSYDVAVMTEMIEHIPNLVEMIEAAMRLIRPGGDLVLTTPNKSASLPHVLWDTDSPPVHLWWLSERSIAKIGERVGATVKFVDFTEFNRSHSSELDAVRQMAEPTVPPAFDEHGQLILKPHPLKAPLRRVFFGLGLDRIRRAAERHQAAGQPLSSRRQTLCAILTKPA